MSLMPPSLSLVNKNRSVVVNKSLLAATSSRQRPGQLRKSQEEGNAIQPLHPPADRVSECLVRQSASSAGEAVSEAEREGRKGAREESPVGRRLTRATLVSHLTFTSELGSGPSLSFYADLSLSLASLPLTLSLRMSRS